MTPPPPLVALGFAVASGGGPDLYRMDMPLPPRPPSESGPEVVPRSRTLGTPTTLFVNFDGVELSACNPSDARRNCSWYNLERAFEPFSGTQQTQVSILQAMRRDVAAYGIAVTGVRPVDGEYTMIVYGGTEEAYGALGSAPSGDCDDALPNQIGFAHLDGDLNAWVNGGATTALHEAAHTWGLDHIDIKRSVMFPEGGNGPTAYRDGCADVVANADLTPGTATCPELNRAQCGAGDRQNASARLSRLFGPAYVDAQAPAVTLVEPRDGQYFQAPATFPVVLEATDDLHPQAYTVWAWIGEGGRPEASNLRIDPSFRIQQLPEGIWDVHVVVADEAGNETRIDFSVEVGEDPPGDPLDANGCSCAAARPTPDAPLRGGRTDWTLWAALLLARQRRQG